MSARLAPTAAIILAVFAAISTTPLPRHSLLNSVWDALDGTFLRAAAGISIFFTLAGAHKCVLRVWIAAACAGALTVIADRVLLVAVGPWFDDHPTAGAVVDGALWGVSSAVAGSIVSAKLRVDVILLVLTVILIYCADRFALRFAYGLDVRVDGFHSATRLLIAAAVTVAVAFAFRGAYPQGPVRSVGPPLVQ